MVRGWLAIGASGIVPLGAALPTSRGLGLVTMLPDAAQYTPGDWLVLLGPTVGTHEPEPMTTYVCVDIPL